jgi:hypothetical protein
MFTYRGPKNMLTIRTEALIHAPIDKVWLRLTDFANYANWNPYMNASAVRLEEKEKVKLSVAFPGLPKMQVRARLISVQSPSELKWIGHLVIPGLFTGEHYFLLEKISDKQTRLIHGEFFSGIFVSLAKGLVRKTENGFHLFNAKIKEACEPKNL